MGHRHRPTSRPTPYRPHRLGELRRVQSGREDTGQRELINASPSDIFTQLALHEVHHRAQAMNILRRLGAKAEDLDYNTLMYTRRPI